MSSILRGVYTTEQKWHGSDKNWNGSNSFCKETVKFYPFRLGSTGAYGPVTERIKLHCFFAKTIGIVPVFVGSVPFLLCRVNAPLKPPLGLRKQMDTTHSPQSSLVHECGWGFQYWHVHNHFRAETKLKLSERSHGKFWLLGVLYITRYDTFLFILVFFLEKTTYTDKGEKVRKQIY